jgi:hypothetical protein
MESRSPSNNLTVKHCECLHHPPEDADHGCGVAVGCPEPVERKVALRQHTNGCERQAEEAVMSAGHLAAHRLAYRFGW